jgi:large subunit ribosomal protein L32e
MSNIDHRKKIKAKKPTFSAQDSHKLKRIKPRWRRPKGLQSKMRLKHTGYHSHISHGWRSPVSVRGQTKDGLFPIIVHKATDLTVIDNKTQAVIIASSVSSKNKIMIYEKAKEHGVLVLNRKIDKLPAKIEEVKQQKEKIKKEREEKKESAKKKEKKTQKGKKAKKETEEEIEEERVEEELQETKDLVKTPKKDTLQSETKMEAEKINAKEKANAADSVTEKIPKSDGKQNK